MVRELIINQRELIINQRELVINQRELIINQRELIINQGELIINQRELVINQGELIINQGELVINQMITSTQLIYVYAPATAPCTADESSFTVTINDSPTADVLSDVTECDSYTLPALSVGNEYWTGTGGTGTQLFAGDMITSTQLIYVYAPATAPCTADESSFTVTINDSPTADVLSSVTECDSYTLPALSAGNEYWTGTGGTGTQLFAGDMITSTQDVFVYAPATAPCTADESSFTVTINDSPTADVLSNVTECDSYELQPLSPGNEYWTGTGGTGTQLFAGDMITSTQDVFVYAPATAPCTADESSFTVTINDSPTADVLSSVTECDSYTLPALSAGNEYWTGTGGTGTQLFAGDMITSLTQDVFVYAPATAPCTADESSFTVTINDSPTADVLSSVTECDSYTLPALSAGNEYWTGTGGTGTQLFAGDMITSTQDVFVYAPATAPCTADESSFTVTINDSPTADVLSDVTECDSYTLPALSAGNEYWTATGGTGTQLFAGDMITSTQLIYVYAPATAPCTADESSFTVTINDSPTADVLSSVTECDSYTLPALSAGNEYWTGTGGTGTQLFAGDMITSTQDVFVYAPATAPCTGDENVFSVTINPTPEIINPGSQSAAGSYILPLITGTNLSGNEAYYDDSQANNGQPVAGPITSTMTVWIYDETGTTPNCSDEESFLVTILNNPVAKNDINLTMQDVAVSGNVLTNDEDPEGYNLIVNTTPISGPLNGTLILNPDGTYTYTPNTGFVGEDIFEYEVCNDAPTSSCDYAIVVISVFSVNDPYNNPPIGVSDHIQTPLNTEVSGNVLSNDTDPEGGVLSVSSTLVLNPVNGTLSINADGSFTYTPNPGFIGTENFIYEICDDGVPVLCEEVLVTIDVLPFVDLNGVVANDDAGVGEQNQDLQGSVTDNDYAFEGNSLVYNLISGVTNGTLVFNPDGTFVYTPNQNFIGNDQFTYLVCNDEVPPSCDVATVYLSVIFGIPDPCDPPIDGQESNILGTSADFTWTSVNTPVNDHCWNFYIGNEGFDCDENEEFITATVCFINDIPTSNNPLVPADQIMVNAETGKVTIHVNGLQPGTIYEWAVFETCDGFLTDNPWDCSDALFGPFQTYDDPYVVNWTDSPASCNSSSPGFAPDGSFSVTIEDSPTCTGIYDIVVTSGPYTLDPAGYSGVTAGTYTFEDAGPGSYTVQITETSVCLPFNDPEVITVVVVEGVDMEAPVFYVADILGNIIADNDPVTIESDNVELSVYNLPEGSCNYQEQWYVYGFDYCDGVVTTQGAVTSEVTSLFLEESDPGTQVLISEDELGNYLVDVNWDADHSKISICMTDLTGNESCVEISREVLEFNNPDVSITGAANITIPHCADSRDVVVTVYIDDLCEGAGNIFSSGSFVANGTEMLNFSDFSDGAGYAEFIVTVTLADDGTIWYAEFTDAFGNTGYSEIQVSVEQAMGDEEPVIIAADENQVIPYCEEETAFCYSFQIYDDCAPVDPALLTFNAGNSGLSEDVLNDFYIDIDNQTNIGFFEVCGVVLAGEYVFEITYDGQVVEPQVLINQQQNQAPEIILPGNLNFTIPACQEELVTTIAVQFADDCDEIDPEEVSVVIGDQSLNVADAFINGGYFEWEVVLNSDMDGDHITASYTDSNNQNTTTAATLTITEQPDNWAPVIIYPSQNFDIEVGPCESPETEVCFDVTAIDNCDGAVIPVVTIDGLPIDLTSESVYCVTVGLGSFTVEIQAGDASGNTDEVSFEINVTQTTPPEDNLACLGTVNVTLEDNCTVILDPGTALIGEWGCLTEGDFEIIVFDDNPSNGDVIDGCGTFDYMIALAEGVGGNFTNCWGTVIAEDKTAPTINCPPSTNQSLVDGSEFICTDINQLFIEEVQYYTAYADGSIVSGSVSADLDWILSQTGYPEVGDNCGLIRVAVWDVLSESDCGDDVITRYFEVSDRYESDCSGTPMIASCTQEIYVRKPGLADVDLPESIVDVECSDDLMLTEDGYPHPSETGYPTITTAFETLEIAETFCTLGATFEDSAPIGICANSYKVIRTWSMVDWCNPIPVTTYEQIIKVGDSQPPVISCNWEDTDWDGIPDMPVYSTGPFDCTAVFQIPVPEISDNCNDYIWFIDVVIHVEEEVLDQWGQVIGTEIVEQILDSYGPFSSEQEGPFVTGVPMSILGNHYLHYTAIDACGNSSVFDCEFAVEDQINPVAVCNDELTISIGGEDYARVYAEDVDEGSNDNCGEVSIQVRRNGGEWGEYVDFDCEDVNTLVTIELQVIDAAGNSNICWLEILVEDKIIPYCHAPHNESLHCDDDLLLHIDWDNIDELNETFGEAWAEDNCNAVAQQIVVINNLNDCGWGTVVRTFEATDDWGNVSTNLCEQVITVYEVHNYEIKFPKDASEECGVPNSDTLVYNTLGCDLITVNVQDEPYEATSDECYKILRTYKVINWCEWDGESAPIVIERDEDCDDAPGDEDVYVMVRTIWNGDSPQYITYMDRDNDESNTNPFIGTSRCTNLPKPNGHWANSSINIELTSVGHWQYTQVIKVYDFVAPTAEVGSYDVFCSENDQCNGDVNISFTVEELCDLDVVSVEGFIDLYADELLDGDAIVTTVSTDEETNSIIFEISGTYPLGTHMFGVHIEDGCNNVTWLEIPFEVTDCKAPTPVCINGLTVTLMPQVDGCCAMAIWASDFIASEVEDCTEPIRYSIHREADVIDGSDIPNPEATGLVLDCNDESEVVILIYSWDSAYNPYAVQPDGSIGGPNYDYCETYVMVQAHEDCAPAGLSMVSGVIETEEMDGVEDVEVMLSGNSSDETYTVSDGSYEFSVLENGYDYTITPHLDENDGNGVTTYDLVLITKHILAVQLLDSPYKMIAADANNSGSITTADMIQIRKLILGIYDEFPNNTSWRFVDADYGFPDPSNPWLEEFPEFRNINNLSEDMLAENFIGAKIGDVNGSAVPNFTIVEERHTEGIFTLITDNIPVEAGNQYSVVFRTKNISEIKGYQFTLNFDNSVLQFDGVAYGNATQENFGLTFVNEGMVTVSWNLPDEVNSLPEEVQFTLNFLALENGFLSDLIEIGSRITPAEAYDLGENMMDVDLSFKNQDVLIGGFELYQNTPNPFDRATVIGYYLPEDGGVEIAIQDITGRTLKVFEVSGKKGHNKFILEANSLEATGVLYYTTSYQEYTATKKMILMD